MCVQCLDILNIKGLEAEAQSRKNRRVSVVVEGNSVLKSEYKSCNNLELMFSFLLFPSWGWSSQGASAMFVETKQCDSTSFHSAKSQIETSSATRKEETCGVGF